MLEIVPSNQFKKDLKLARKRGCKIEHLRDVVNTLASGQKLDLHYFYSVPEHILIYFSKFCFIDRFSHSYFCRKISFKSSIAISTSRV